MILHILCCVKACQSLQQTSMSLSGSQVPSSLSSMDVIKSVSWPACRYYRIKKLFLFMLTIIRVARFESKRGRIYTVSFPGRHRPILEDMSEMGATFGAQDLVSNQMRFLLQKLMIAAN